MTHQDTHFKKVDMVFGDYFGWKCEANIEIFSERSNLVLTNF
jgi:hypothetical protein